MKMFRKNISYICLGLMMLILNACNNQIDLSPPSNYNAKDFYRTQNDFSLAIGGTYGGLRGIHSMHYPLLVESISDNVSTLTNNAYTRLSIIDNDPYVLSLWSAYWTIIMRANNILDQIDEGEFSDQSLQKRIKGEALFIRGFCYFQLGWLFDGVPIIDRVMDESELLQLTRPDVSETFAFAELNLLQASELLPDENVGEHIGRATSYAAQGLLGRLYLFTRQYEKAKTALEAVINSNKYHMYENFEDCFLNTKDNGNEHVFQIQYTEGLIDQGNQLVYTLVPENIRSEKFPNGGRSLWLAVSNDLYESYMEEDVRRDITIQKGYRTSSDVVDETTLLFVKYAHGDVPNLPQDNDVNLSVIRYTDVLLMYGEVLNELQYEADGRALEIVNAVRKRAGIVLYEPNELSSQSDFRSAIFQERRLEFACEFLRWFDLVRMDTDQATAVMEAFVNRNDEGNGMYTFDPKFFLLPIPAAERQVNNNMTQNFGY